MADDTLSLPIINTQTNPPTITMSLADYQLIINNAFAYTMGMNPFKRFPELKLVNEEQAKEALGCDSLTLATLRTQRKIVSVGEGKKIMYSESSINSYIKHFKEVSDDK